MKTRLRFLPAVVAALTLLLLPAPLLHAFSYQGVLSQNGSNAQGQFEMTFQLLQADTANPVGDPVTQVVDVVDGLFQVDLAFDPLLFDGTPYDLQISVRVPGGPIYVLSPPTRLSAAPQALFANSVGSVPDGALGTNVARLDQPAAFGGNVSMPLLMLQDPTGQARLVFGDDPDDLCVIAVDPSVAPGLLLRDPGGIRLLPPDPVGTEPPSPPSLFFGPTDECLLFVDPSGRTPGLSVVDPSGLRLLGHGGSGCRLIFGPTMDCTIEVDPIGPPGLQLRDPSGIRILNPNAAGPRQLIFGPTDDCRLMVDPSTAFPGLTAVDPNGFRIAGSGGNGCRLIFGPTMDCTIEVDPGGPPGLQLRDPSGVRILNPTATGPRQLIFGPTDECRLIVDPSAAVPGLTAIDPNGFRIAGSGGNGCRLIFGPTMDCTIEVSPGGPSGLLLRDPSGVRILSPNANDPPRLIFGPTDECRLGIDPSGAIPGLIAYEPNGLRLIDETKAEPSLLFGPTDECRIRVAGDATGGNPQLRFEDPNGFLFTNDTTVQGTLAAQQFVQQSTRRLKENIQPLDNALELIEQLQAVRYDWKAEQGGRADIGFIAEEVGRIVPEVVQWEEDGAHARGINYGHLVAVAVEGIKAQQAEIETLRNEKADLESRLARLEALVLGNRETD